jgi:hypothetical protein
LQDQINTLPQHVDNRIDSAVNTLKKALDEQMDSAVLTAVNKAMGPFMVSMMKQFSDFNLDTHFKIDTV